MLPNDVRGFVHKRIGRGLKSFVGSGFNPIAGAAGFLSSGEPARTGRRTGGSPNQGLLGRRFTQPRQCRSGQIRVGRTCVDPSKAAPFGDPLFSKASGATVMGRYGAALTPLVEDRMVRECLPGMVLGNDGNCYNKSQITNKQREWPRGTRPLGTPGEMAALSKAARFGKRMETTVKRMQKIGVLKKPASRSRPRGRGGRGGGRGRGGGAPDTQIISVGE